jgi:hypothetical protein
MSRGGREMLNPPTPQELGEDLGDIPGPIISDWLSWRTEGSEQLGKTTAQCLGGLVSNGKGP